MPADTYDPVLGLVLQGTGNNNNAWGTVLNNSMIKLAARATAGMIVRSVSGGTLDLSGSPPPATARQDIDAMQNITGTLSSHQTIIVPAISKTWLIGNGTSGAFQLFVKTTGQVTPAQVPQGCWKMLFCDGTNVLRFDDDAIGTVRISTMSAAQVGEMICNGASLLRADYPRLFQKLGGTWGAVDGTHFNIPDFVTGNRFLRQYGGALAFATVQTSQNITHTHLVSGTAAAETTEHTHSFGTSGAITGTYRDYSGQGGPDHTHSNIPKDSGYTSGGYVAVGAGNINYIYSTQNSGAADRFLNHNHTCDVSGTSGGRSASHTHSVSITSGNGSVDGAEARPNNIAVNFVMLY